MHRHVMRARRGRTREKRSGSCLHSRASPIHTNARLLVICRQSTLSIFAGRVTLWPMFVREPIQRQPTWLVLLEALVLVGLIGWVDHVTVWDLNCFVLYAAPIILVAWKTGWRLGFVFAFLCAATDWVADNGGNPYQTHWGFVLAVAGEFFYFSILVVAVTAVKGRRELDRMRIETLERAQSLERHHRVATVPQNANKYVLLLSHQEKYKHTMIMGRGPSFEDGLWQGCEQNDMRYKPEPRRVRIVWFFRIAILAAMLLHPPSTFAQRLGISAVNGTQNLFWPQSGYYYLLQSSTNLSGSNAWLNVATASPVSASVAAVPILTNYFEDTIVVTQSVANAPQFFRLKAPVFIPVCSFAIFYPKKLTQGFYCLNRCARVISANIADELPP